MQNLAAIASAHAYTRVLKRWWWLPVVLGIASAVVTYAGTDALIRPEYGSKVVVQVGQLNPTNAGAGVMSATTAATDMTGTDVIQRAWNVIHTRPGVYPAIQDPTALTQRVTCSADVTNTFVTCTTTSRNVNVPPQVLNILANVFIPWERNLLTHNYHRSEEVYIRLAKHARSPSVRQQANENLAGLISTEATEEGYIRTITNAQVQRAPVSPHPLRNAILGAIVGIGLAAALIVLLEYLDDTFRSADEIVEATNLPLLGSVRKYEGTADEMATVAARMPRTAIAEAYRVSRANIQFTEIGGTLKVLVVTSARDGEGKTTTANNLATTFAQAGQRVLLVDADLRRPGLTKIMGMRDQHGLSSALLDPDADVIAATDVVGLSVVPSGAIPPNPSELLGSQRMRTFIENAAREYDLIILDTPPVLSVADTRIVATVADGVILVLDPAITTRRMVRQARIAVENVGGRILGIMLNRDVMRGEGYYYNYYYYERRRERDRAGSR